MLFIVVSAIAVAMIVPMAVIVIAATQRPSHDVLATSVRDLFSLRVAHACATREASAMILGLPDGGLAEKAEITGAGWAAVTVTVTDAMENVLPCPAALIW